MMKDCLQFLVEPAKKLKIRLKVRIVQWQLFPFVLRDVNKFFLLLIFTPGVS